MPELTGGFCLESSLTSWPFLLPQGGTGLTRRHLTRIRFFSTLSWTKSIPILFSRWYRHSSATCRKQWEIMCSPCRIGIQRNYVGHDLIYSRGNPDASCSLTIVRLSRFLPPHHNGELSWLQGVQYWCVSHRIVVQVNVTLNIQLTFEQYGFQLHGSTYMRSFFPINTVAVFSGPYDFLTNLSFL